MKKCRRLFAGPEEENPPAPSSAALPLIRGRRPMWKTCQGVPKQTKVTIIDTKELPRQNFCGNLAANSAPTAILIIEGKNQKKAAIGGLFLCPTTCSCPIQFATPGFAPLPATGYRLLL
jgi:hypothetical protein